MRRVFADSFYFFALLSKDDRKHAEAVQFSTTFRGEAWTTPWVLTEVADGLAKPPWRQSFLSLRESLAQNPHIRIEPCTDELWNAGVELYGNRQDKPWSLTDCISFVVMQRANIVEALTGDHDFEQAGFVALLK
jgi:uncharacterized protein